MIAIKQTTKGLCFEVYVQPRASRTTIVGCHQAALKIKLTAPPIGGAANKQCCQVLAKALAIPRSAISITHGHTHRRKGICLTQAGDSASQKLHTLASKIQRLGANKTKKTA